jgi:hypothetical protein
MFCSSTLISFIRFHSQPRRLLHFTFASIGHYPEHPRVGSRFTLHTAPHLCCCLTVCFHTPLWGPGLFVTHELSKVVLCGHDTSELLSYQNPRDKHLSPESPLLRLILLLLPHLFEPAARRLSEGS